VQRELRHRLARRDRWRGDVGLPRRGWSAIDLVEGGKARRRLPARRVWTSPPASPWRRLVAVQANTPQGEFKRPALHREDDVAAASPHTVGAQVDSW